MKIRNGFVSNSSSSSFMIHKDHVSVAQMELIENHIEEARKREREGTYDQHASCNDAWSISQTDTHIKGSTWMDNFDMEDYLVKVVGIDKEHLDMRYS
jgi:hypothetical protein